jgi:hypothetical protein
MVMFTPVVVERSWWYVVRARLFVGERPHVEEYAKNLLLNNQHAARFVWVGCFERMIERVGVDSPCTAHR